jgi:hypothetical protein
MQIATEAGKTSGIAIGIEMHVLCEKIGITFGTPMRLAKLPGFEFGNLLTAPGPGALARRPFSFLFLPRIWLASCSFCFFRRSYCAMEVRYPMFQALRGQK